MTVATTATAPPAPPPEASQKQRTVRQRNASKLRRGFPAAHGRSRLLSSEGGRPRRKGKHARNRGTMASCHEQVHGGNVRGVVTQEGPPSLAWRRFLENVEWSGTSPSRPNRPEPAMGEVQNGPPARVGVLTNEAVKAACLTNRDHLIYPNDKIGKVGTIIALV